MNTVKASGCEEKPQASYKLISVDPEGKEPLQMKCCYSPNIDMHWVKNLLIKRLITLRKF